MVTLDMRVRVDLIVVPALAQHVNTHSCPHQERCTYRRGLVAKEMNGFEAERLNVAQAVRLVPPDREHIKANLHRILI